MNLAFWCAGGGVRTRPEKDLPGGTTKCPARNGSPDWTALQQAPALKEISR